LSKVVSIFVVTYFPYECRKDFKHT